MSSDGETVSFAGRIWGVIKSHKKKLIALGTITALGVGGYYYAKRMLMDGMRQVEEIGRGIQKKMMETQHRQNELTRLRQECASMVGTFIPPLRTTVKLMTDPKPVTERLKAVRLARKNSTTPSLPEEEQEVKVLWDELKVVSLARLFTSVYAVGLLNAVLRIQLHVLGRYSFEEAAEKRKEQGNAQAELSISATSDEVDHSRISRKLRERFLFSGSDHLMSSGEGMRKLVSRVHNSIKVASKNWLMGTDAKVTRWEVLEMVDTIRSLIESDDKNEASTQDSQGLHLGADAREWIVQCLVNDDEEGSLFKPDRELDEDQNRFCKEMLDETLDMVESPMFALAAEQAFDSLFSVLKREIQSRPFEVYKDDGEEKFLLTKVIVNLKLLAGEVLSESSPLPNADTSSTFVGENEFQRALSELSILDDLCKLVFQQGAEESSDSPLDALGLGDLGINDEDLQSLAGLLGGLGGQDGSQGAGGFNEAELLKMMASFTGSETNGQSGNNQFGGIDEEQLMQALQSSMSSPSSQPAPSS